MDQEERHHSSAYDHFKFSMDIGMGVLYIIISGYAMKMNFIIEKYGKQTVWIIASLFILYGSFRIVRGGISFWKLYSSKGRK